MPASYTKMGLTAKTCDRTRAWVSIALDEELSEFEHALLRAHLRRCAACATFAEGVKAATEALRAEPLEPVPFAMAAPAGRQIRRRLARGGAVAATALIAVGVGTTLAERSGGVAKARTFPGPTAAALRDERFAWSGGLPRVNVNQLPLGLGHRLDTSL